MNLEKIRKGINKITGNPTCQVLAYILSPFGIVVLMEWLMLKGMANPTKEQTITIHILSFAMGIAAFSLILNQLQLKAMLQHFKNVADNFR